MNIWVLQTGEPLPTEKHIRKMRTALLCEELVKRGHNVFWWASAFEHQRKTWICDRQVHLKVSSGLTIRPLRGCGYYANISIRRYIDHMIVASKFRRESKGMEIPDLIVASTPCYHLAYEGMVYSKKNDTPLVVDIRDLWPDILLGHLKRARLEKLGRLALAKDFAKARRLFMEADSLVGASHGCLNWGLNKIGRAAGDWDKVFYHGYKSSREFAAHSPNRSAEFKGKKVFLFVGTFGHSYELGLVLEAAKKFGRKGENQILFFLVGTGEQHESLKREGVGLKNVLMPGWLGSEDIGELLHLAWAGIVPCRSVKHAAPNKVFEYLSAGLPLISSLEGEMAELAERYRFGMSYQTGNVASLCRCIEKLADDRRLRDEMSANAISFFRKSGEAEKIYADYAEHIERLVEARRG